MGALKSSKERGRNLDIDTLEVEDVSSDNPNGKGLTCKFSLHYSFVRPSSPKNQNPKNIIFIPGGPGTISELEDVDFVKHGAVAGSVRFRSPTDLIDFSVPTTSSKTSKGSGLNCSETISLGTRFGERVMEL